MTGNRWARIEAIAAAALDCSPSERPALLDRECADDEALRQEVESLLGFEGAAEGFLQQSAMEEAAQVVANQDIADEEDWTIDGYDIAEFIGAGGMGDVYRARDRRLERDVAIKVIRRSLGDSPVTFEEEARAASALSHPNIVTIYAVGSRDDLAYIVMELVQGRTLRALLANSPLPLVTSLDIALQLAEGLAAAHALGIVHRDLKPDNVMVTADGLVKILDFGIAKRGRTSNTSPHESATSPVTATTTLAGTAGYMSPEQAARGAVDHRSDQFSFGAIVHEMLAGTRPSDARSIQPVSLGVPAPLEHVISRCLSPRAEQRYDHTRELALEIRRIRDDSVHMLRQQRVTRRHAIWVGATAALTLVTGAAAWRVLADTRRLKRLLVLPFTSVASDEHTDLLCDGIAEVLIKQLGRMADVAVMGRDTAFSLKGKTNDPRELGRQLEIDAVLNGSVVRRGGRVLVRVELVKASTGILLWGDEFNRPEGDVLAIQDEIAAGIITHGLGRSLSSEERLVLNRMLTANPEAYRQFLSAVHHLRLGNEADYLMARELLEDAVARDPAFALAHVTLASTYSVSAIDGFEAPGAAWAQQRQHVTRALQADPELPDAIAERATEAFFHRWDWAAAQREWDKALNARSELQAELLTAYALQQWALGRNADALRFGQAAREIDPLSSGLAVREADFIAATGQFAAAADLYTRIIKEAPDQPSAYFGLAEVWRSSGRFDDAIEVWRRAFHSVGNASLDDAFAVARGENGYRDLARRMAELELADLETRAESGAYVSSADLARVHARLGRYEQSFTFLDAAFEERAPGLVFLKVDRAWDGMRRDHRFAAHLRRMKLD